MASNNEEALDLFAHAAELICIEERREGGAHASVLNTQGSRHGDYFVTV